MSALDMRTVDKLQNYHECTPMVPTRAVQGMVWQLLEAEGSPKAVAKACNLHTETIRRVLRGQKVAVGVIRKIVQVANPPDPNITRVCFRSKRRLRMAEVRR